MIYMVLAPSMRAVKIGYAENADKRIAELQCGCPEDYQILTVFPGGRDDEGGLHTRFAEYRIRGEWFRNEGEIAQFAWDMGDQTAPIPNPLALSDVWHAINRFDDRPVRLRRIICALADGEVDLEGPKEPSDEDISEPVLHALIRAFVEVDNDYDDKNTISS